MHKFSNHWLYVKYNKNKLVLMTIKKVKHASYWKNKIENQLLKLDKYVYLKLLRFFSVYAFET
jgi:hypothetical protein